MLFVGEEHQQRQERQEVMSLFIQFVHLLYSFILFVGEEHQQRQGNTNKGKGLFVGEEHQQRQSWGCSFEYVMSSFMQFVHLLYSFMLFVGEEHQQRQRQRQGNTNKGKETPLRKVWNIVIKGE
jgi:hypothetical protein